MINFNRSTGSVLFLLLASFPLSWLLAVRTTVAAELHGEITDQQRTDWTASMDPADWATESLERTRKSNVRYCTLVGDECRYTQARLLFTDGSGKARKITLKASYEDAHGPFLEMRIQQAGVRLGKILNEILGN